MKHLESTVQTSIIAPICQLLAGLIDQCQWCNISKSCARRLCPFVILYCIKNLAQMSLNPHKKYDHRFQLPFWSMRTTWWTSVSSTVHLTPIGCQTSWTSSLGHYRLLGRKVGPGLPTSTVWIVFILILGWNLEVQICHNMSTDFVLDEIWPPIINLYTENCQYVYDDFLFIKQLVMSKRKCSFIKKN